MRLKKEFIEKISKKIIKSLSSKDLIIWEGDHSRLESIISNIIIEDLMVEDRLNDEVKQLLDSRTEEYERSMMDYGRVFQLVKSKLARERGLIF
ncbi:uncharacterized protein METZ01_LOCUS302689 [marine metagenome]|uniref:DUF507 domain-containing protein n=1 Tax=marine metagenome TaxID=408172 RepID=A0A382MNV8_9ZZZZ